MANTRLNYLEDLSDYKVASDDPDVRGWKIYDRDENLLGKVDHLLADVEKKRVRYLDIAPEKDLLKDGAKVYDDSAQGTHEYRDRKGDVHMIVPIGMARLDTNNKRVVADKIDKRTFVGNPLLSKQTPVTMEQERHVRKYFENPTVEHGNDNVEERRKTIAEENRGTPDANVKRDTAPESGSPETRAERPSQEEKKAKEVTSHDDKHIQKTTPENSGVPNVDSRAQNVDSSASSTSRPKTENKEDARSRDTIQSSGRPMRPEKSNEAQMTSGAPDSLEAGATTAGAQAGRTNQSSSAGSGKIDNPEMNVDPGVSSGKTSKGEKEHLSREERESRAQHRESDESAARRKQSGDDDYSSEDYDEDRFYNRKK